MGKRAIGQFKNEVKVWKICHNDKSSKRKTAVEVVERLPRPGSKKICEACKLSARLPRTEQDMKKKDEGVTLQTLDGNKEGVKVP